MPRLIRNSEGEVQICQGRLYNADYGTIYVADVDFDTILPDNWVYTDKDLEVEDFALPWKQPEGAHDAYALGALVSHNNTRWRSTIVGNVWAPGVSGWANADTDIPTWIQPLGAHDAYAEGSLVQHNGQMWKNLIPANTFAPGVSGWREAVLMPPSGDPVYPAWVQPVGGHDAYALGDKVTHNAQVWTSTVADNVWEPGVYGWIADV